MDDWMDKGRLMRWIMYGLGADDTYKVEAIHAHRVSGDRDES